MFHRLLLVVCVLINITDLPLSYGTEWNYEELGPDVWPDLFEDCGKKSQSPINIKTICTTYRDFPAFQFSPAYNMLQNFQITNNGHTVNGVQNNSIAFPLTLSGGGLTENFTFVNFHLHWGENYGTGSEHQLNGKKYSGEIHLVHTNAAGSQYAVLGIFIQSKPASSSGVSRRKKRKTKRAGSTADSVTLVEWERYIDASDDLTETNASTLISLRLTSLMGKNLDKFYRYAGSLTTPLCTESVIWTVFEEPVVFSEDELEAFRANLFSTNFREPQPLNGRIVYRNFATATNTSVSDYGYCADDVRTTTSTQSTSAAPISGSSKLVTNIPVFMCSIFFLFIAFFLI